MQKSISTTPLSQQYNMFVGEYKNVVLAYNAVVLPLIG